MPISVVNGKEFGYTAKLASLIVALYGKLGIPAISGRKGPPTLFGATLGAIYPPWVIWYLTALGAQSLVFSDLLSRFAAIPLLTMSGGLLVGARLAAGWEFALAPIVWARWIFSASVTKTCGYSGLTSFLVPASVLGSAFPACFIFGPMWVFPTVAAEPLSKALLALLPIALGVIVHSCFHGVPPMHSISQNRGLSSPKLVLGV